MISENELERWWQEVATLYFHVEFNILAFVSKCSGFVVVKPVVSSHIKEMYLRYNK